MVIEVKIEKIELKNVGMKQARHGFLFHIFPSLRFRHICKRLSCTYLHAKNMWNADFINSPAENTPVAPWRDGNNFALA